MSLRERAFLCQLGHRDEGRESRKLCDTAVRGDILLGSYRGLCCREKKGWIAAGLTQQNSAQDWDCSEVPFGPSQVEIGRS